MQIKQKKFLVVPRDAFEMLSRRYAKADEAIGEAEHACAEEGQTMYVLEIKAVAARVTPPVTVTKL